jgi:hypothetical protein
MGRNARMMTMAAGPSLSVLLVAHLASAGTIPAAWLTTVAMTVLVVAWSPLFCSVPALLTQDARDDTLVGVTGPARAVLLLPALLTSEPAVRDEQIVALAGLAAGALLAVGL